MNKITIALCEEDRKLLEGLMGSVTLLASVLANSQPKEVQEKVIAKTAPVEPDPAMEHPVAEVSPHAEPAPEIHPDEIPEVTASTHKWTQADILAIVQRLIAPGSTKRAEAKAIVNDYAVKISAIPEEKYPEVMDRLIALEKEGA